MIDEEDLNRLTELSNNILFLCGKLNTPYKKSVMETLEKLHTTIVELDTLGQSIYRYL